MAAESAPDFATWFPRLRRGVRTGRTLVRRTYSGIVWPYLRHQPASAEAEEQRARYARAIGACDACAELIDYWDAEFRADRTYTPPDEQLDELAARYQAMQAAVDALLGEA